MLRLKVNLPIFVSQLFGLFLLNFPLISQVGLVPDQNDVRVLTVGVGLQLACKLNTKGKRTM